MTTPTYRELTLDELQDRGWLLTPPAEGPDGLLSVTLVLPGDDDTIVHAVTGQGRTGSQARQKAIEMTNVWRRKQAEGQTNQ